MTETKDNREVATIKDLVTFRSLDELRSWGDEVAKTGFTPLKKGSDVVAAVLAGQELGLRPMFSANNIHPVNGRATLGVHAITKLLLEAGVTIEVLRDYEPCVNFVMKGEDGLAVLLDANGNEAKRDTAGKGPAGSYPIVLKQDFADVEPKAHEVKGKKPVCYKTVIKLTRHLKQPHDGSYKEVSMTDSFSTADAAQADLLKKDNWKGYPRQMCYARALALVGRKLCADILGGLPETSEFADVHGIRYTMSTEGEVRTEEVEHEDVTETTGTGDTGEQGNAPVDTGNNDKDSQ